MPKGYAMALAVSLAAVVSTLAWRSQSKVEFPFIVLAAAGTAMFAWYVLVEFPKEVGQLVTWARRRASLMARVPIWAVLVPKQQITHLSIVSALTPADAISRVAGLGGLRTSEASFAFLVRGEEVFGGEGGSFTPTVELVCNVRRSGTGSELRVDIRWPLSWVLGILFGYVVVGGILAWVVIASLLNPGFWAGALSPSGLFTVLALLALFILLTAFVTLPVLRSLDEALAQALGPIHATVSPD